MSPEPGWKVIFISDLLSLTKAALSDGSVGSEKRLIVSDKRTDKFGNRPSGCASRKTSCASEATKRARPEEFDWSSISHHQFCLQSFLCVSEVLFCILNFPGVRAPRLLTHLRIRKICRINIGQINRFNAEVENTCETKEEICHFDGNRNLGGQTRYAFQGVDFLVRGTPEPCGELSSQSHWMGYERTRTSRRHWKRMAEVEEEIEYRSIERGVLD
ncbi:hypothetical protein C8R45DRAFT_1017677, partial [Mycena sanguinolenta]